MIFSLPVRYLTQTNSNIFSIFIFLQSSSFSEEQSYKKGIDHRAVLTNSPPCKRGQRGRRNSLCWTDYWWIQPVSYSLIPAPSCRRWTRGNSHRRGCHRGIQSRTHSGWDNLIPLHTDDCGTLSVFNSRN